MNLRILSVLLKKEVLLMKRNVIIPRMIAVMPIVVMLIVPLAVTLDVKNVDVAVMDNDNTELSRRMVADMDASEYLIVRSVNSTYEEAFRQIEKGDADVIVSIPKNYMRDIANGKRVNLDIRANGVNATKGALGAQYSIKSLTKTVLCWKEEQGEILPQFECSTVNLYNPTLNYRNYMIPALMVVLLILICGFLPTLNLVSEKESGTIEAINVTPVGRLEFVLSKLIPYWVVGVLVVTVGMLIGWLVYGLVPAGSVVNIYLATILFSLVMSGLGVFIANKSATILQSIFVIFAFVMVFQLMSGLFTPIASMPRWAQYITYAIPPRYFIEIIRSVYLKGSDLIDIWPQYLSLVGFAVFFCIVATATYKKQA